MVAMTAILNRTLTHFELLSKTTFIEFIVIYDLIIKTHISQYYTLIVLLENIIIQPLRLIL